MVAAAAVPYIMAAMAAVSAVSQISQARSQANLQKYNAKVAENNAIATRQQGEYDARQKALATKKLIGTQEAALAANGVVTTEGSPLAIMADTAATGELDRLAILHNSTVKAQAFEAQAAGLRAGASSTLRGGYMGAATSIMGEAESAYSMGAFGSSAGVSANAMGSSSAGVGPFQNTNMLDGQAGTAFNANGDWG